MPTTRRAARRSAKAPARTALRHRPPPTRRRPREGVTPPCDSRDMADSTTHRRPPRAHEPDRIVASWSCPVCERPTPRFARPGRARIYCTNACRQRAYRCRREQRAAGHPALPVVDPERGRSFERSHALRPASDPVVRGRHDSIGRAITVCGTFSRRATRPPFAHTRYVADVTWACRTCATLVRIAGPGPVTLAGAPMPPAPRWPDRPDRGDRGEVPPSAAPC